MSDPRDTGQTWLCQKYSPAEIAVWNQNILSSLIDDGDTIVKI